MKKQAVITATDLCIGYRTHKGEKKKCTNTFLSDSIREN